MRDLRSPLDGLRSPFGASRGPTGPTNTVAPVVSGTPTVGQTTSSTTGTWTGVGTITYAYQWLKDGVAISGATSSTYTLTAGEEGGFISCRVTATDDNGSTAATSNSVGPVAASSFDPADLFTGTERGLIFEPAEIGTLFTDLSRTTAVTASGDPLGSITDRSGSGNHLAAPSTSDRATYDVTGGIASMSIGAASNERLVTATVTGLTAVDNLTMVVAFTTHGQTGKRPFASGDTAVDYALTENGGHRTDYKDSVGRAVANTFSTEANGTVVVQALVKDGANATHYKALSGGDLTPEVDGSLGTFSADLSAALEVRGDGSKIFFVFLIDKAITGTDWTDLWSHAKTRAGI